MTVIILLGTTGFAFNTNPPPEQLYPCECIHLELIKGLRKLRLYGWVGKWVGVILVCGLSAE